MSPDRVNAGGRRRGVREFIVEYWRSFVLGAALLSFLLALWGFWIADPPDLREFPLFAVTSLTGWAALFVFEPPVPSNTQLDLARALAAVAAVLFGGRAIYLLFRDQIDGLRARTWRSHVIVCGLGRRGTRLVQEFKSRGYRVIGVEHTGRLSAIDAGRQRGALVIAGDATDPLVLERAGVRRARCVISVGPDDATNIGVATTLIGLSERDASSPRPRAVIEVRDDELLRALRNSSEGARGRYAVEFVNIARRAAWSLLDCPEPLEPNDAASPRLLIAGLELMSEELIVACALLWPRLAGSSRRRPQLTLVDRAATEHKARLLRRHEALEAWCELLPVDLAPELIVSERPELLDGTSAPGPTRVYVCLDDPVRGLSTGLQLHRETGMRVPVVVAALSEQESAGRFLKPGAAFEVGVHLFGLIEQTCTVELLLDTPVESIARLIHRDYLRGELARGRTVGETAALRAWEELDDANRESNRASARSARTKLEQAKVGLRELADWRAPSFEFTEAEVEVLARVEHERWLKWMEERGWQPGPRDETTKRHPDLVEWERLSEDTRNKDRNQVRELPRQLARAGYEIYRPSADHDAERLELLAQGIHRAYLEQRLAAGQRLGSTPSTVEWDALPEEFRESSRAQARDAERVFGLAGYAIRPADEVSLPSKLTEEDVDALARLAHERWREERLLAGWRCGTARDDDRRLHPDLVAWAELAEDRRDIDRTLVRELVGTISASGRALTRVPADQYDESS